MDSQLSFFLSYGLMTQTAEKLINRFLERAFKSEGEVAYLELVRARAVMELWYNLALVGSTPFEILDRDRLHLAEMIFYSPADLT